MAIISLEQLEKEIGKIKERNRRVETDKAWETSTARKIIISVGIYFAVALLLSLSKIPDPWVNAAIPALAFYLSTLTLPLFKELWSKYVYKN